MGEAGARAHLETMRGLRAHACMRGERAHARSRRAALASHAHVPSPRRFARAFSRRAVDGEHCGVTFALAAGPPFVYKPCYAFVEPAEEARSFWWGLLLAIALAATPPAIREAVDDQRLSSLSAGLMLMLPLLVFMGASAVVAYAVETGGVLWLSSAWVPSLPAFAAVFGPAFALLLMLSMVVEIKVGAMLMLMHAWLYYA